MAMRSSENAEDTDTMEAGATPNTAAAWSLLPDLRGQIAIVTGGGRGIGRAIGRALSAAGAHVVLTARTESEIAAVAAEIRAAGGAALPIRADQANPDEIRALFARVRDQFGRLDVLINNAAIVRIAKFIDCTLEDFDAQIDINLRGVFVCCQEALKIMIPQRSGYIINVASAVAIKGYLNHTAYGAAKHGVMGLTKVLAMEAQPHQIRVSAILPGGVETDMLSKGQPHLMADRSILLQPEDIAQSALFLLSLPPRAAVDQIYIRRYASAPFST